jgi:hypothetical protein
MFPLPADSYPAFAMSTHFWFGWTEQHFQITRETLVRSKTLYQFPRTEEGWTECWTVITAEFPELASVILRRFDVAAERVAGQEHLVNLQAADDAALRELRSLRTFGRVDGCTLLGGYGIKEEALRVGQSCTVLFTESELWLQPGMQNRAVLRRPYSELTAVEFTGPGKVTKGGGIIGGGFGLTAAAIGIIASSVLNALTRTSEIQTMIRVEGPELEVFLFTASETPDALRIRYAEPLALIRAARETQSAVPTAGRRDLAEQLKDLGELRNQGLLSDEEFAEAKARVLRGE